MQDLIEKLKAHVIERSQDKSFIHNEWFIEYHLNIVEKTSLELYEKYPHANRDIILCLVWIHDYAKIIDKTREHDPIMFEKGREKMLELGFEKTFVDCVIKYLDIFEKKMEINLNDAPIEIKIVSSADAAAHLIGPFWSIYFKENNSKSIKELMESNRKKLAKDWERKIVLPEIKDFFQQRYNLVKEQIGDFPTHYIT